MRVQKRDGRFEDVSFDKVLRRIKHLSDDLKNIDAVEIAKKVINNIHDGVKTSELDELAGRQCYALASTDPDFDTLASRIIISNNHKSTTDSFYSCMKELFDNNLINVNCFKFIEINKEVLDKEIVHDRDYNFSYFSYKTLEKSYLMKVKKVVRERIQYIFMRVSVGLHHPNLNEVLKSYNLMSQGYFTHASPTLFNASSNYQQLLSCFLTAPNDSIDGMYNWVRKLALISKRAGGIGGSISCIRSDGAYIRGTNGYSSGTKPLLKVVNETLKHVNQGGKRPGKAAIYLETHHPDIMSFLELVLNHGNENDRCRDLFIALWISDLFMQRVKNDEEWTLMDPDECPGLDTSYGEEYERLYLEYEKAGKGRETIKAQAIWKKMCESQIEKGMPYTLFKDACNRKSNHKHYGTIKGSNLCVSPDTKILTDKGYEVIKDLADKKVNVWNGKEFSESLVKKTGENQELLKIKFSNGSELECTKYHKFYLNIDDKKVQVEASDLKINDKIWECNFPVILDNKNVQEDLNKVFQDGKNGINPPINKSLKLRIKWYEGAQLWLNSSKNGLVFSKDFNDIEKLKKVVLFLQTLGINSFINNNFLYFNKYSENLTDYGYKKPKIIKEHILKDLSNLPLYNYIISIEKSKISDTYCFNEPKEHAGIFNGIYTGQCAEILEYHDDKEFACCCLSSICLPKFVDEKNYTFDMEKLGSVTAQCVRNLNQVIDRNEYPVPETKYSNFRHRPLGIGVQGLADTFAKLRIPFEEKGKLHPKAHNLNKDIFETMYYYAMLTSMEEAKKYGPYETFKGSPLSEGKFQFDLWGVEPTVTYDWDELRKNVMKYGVRNSLLIACMPTASTAQIMNNTECIEPMTSNLYVRRTLGGEFVVYNKHLVRDLKELNLWSVEMKDKIVAEDGSIQNIPEIPDNIKDLYKTVWEIKQKTLMDLSIGRGPYVCQTQSLNLFFEEPTVKKITKALFYAWEKGLKTGSYYIRSNPKEKPQQFTIDPNLKKKVKEVKRTKSGMKVECTDDICTMCSA
jgi:ribonucleotide reductase alpha subunit